MQTLFTNDGRAGAVEQARWRAVVCTVGAALSAACLATSRWHDVPLAVVFLLTALAEALRSFRPAYRRLLLVPLMGAYLGAGALEIRRGRAFGWALCAWALVFAVSLLVAGRRRPDGARA